MDGGESEVGMLTGAGLVLTNRYESWGWQSVRRVSYFGALDGAQTKAGYRDQKYITCADEFYSFVA